MTSPMRPEPADAVLEIHSRPDGRWTWCYREPDRGVELHSNLDYPTREAATISARRVYPDVPVSRDR